MRAAGQGSAPIFPIGLLLQGRPGLVVGGGKVALRKVRLLLDADATVTAICPEPSEELLALAGEGKVSLQVRAFEPDDPRGFAVAFAATDRPEVNRTVLDACRRLGVLACAVDRLWPEGAFITPASHRRDELVVSVATGGVSCRRSRLVRDTLARHLDMIGSADLLVLGTSHEQLSLERREPYHLADARLEAVGSMLMQVWGVQEFMLLNTCNRVELLGVVSQREDTDELLRRLMRFDDLPPDAYFVHHGYAAFEHLALLSAGLFSQTPGEHHIVAQVKDALQAAQSRGWAAGLMECWVGGGLHVSKHIREAAGPRLRDFEIEDLSLDYLAAQGAAGAGTRALVLGTGVVGEGIVQRCATRGMACVWCYRTKAPTVPESLRERVRLTDMHGLPGALREADVVFCAMASATPVLQADHAPHFDPKKIVPVIDLGLPRNVAPELRALSKGIQVVDLDDLKHWYRRERADLDALLDLARNTAREHREMYERLVQDIQGGDAR